MNHKDLDAMRKRFEDAGIVAPKDDADLVEENAALRAEVERLREENASIQRLCDNLAHNSATHYAQIPRWVRASDRLPDSGGTCIVTDDVVVWTAFWMGHKWLGVLSDGSPTITHWMPLPEPPKEDE